MSCGYQRQKEGEQHTIGKVLVSGRVQATMFPRTVFLVRVTDSVNALL